MDGPRSWGLYALAILSLAIIMWWVDWPSPEQSWRPQTFVPHDNGAVIGCRLLWPSGFL